MNYSLFAANFSNDFINHSNLYQSNVDFSGNIFEGGAGYDEISFRRTDVGVTFDVKDSLIWLNTSKASGMSHMTGFENYVGTSFSDTYIDGPGDQSYGDHGSYGGPDTGAAPRIAGDTFVFAPGHGNDLIWWFDQDPTLPYGISPFHDTLDLRSFGLTSLAQFNPTDDGQGGTVLHTPDGGSIRLFGTPLASLQASDILVNSIPLKWVGTKASDLFEYPLATDFSLPKRTINGGAGVDTLRLKFDVALTDTGFTGLKNLEKLELLGSGAQSLSLGARAAAALHYINDPAFANAGVNGSVSAFDVSAPNASSFFITAGGMVNTQALHISLDHAHAVTILGVSNKLLLLSLGDASVLNAVSAGIEAASGPNGYMIIEMTRTTSVFDEDFNSLHNLDHLIMRGDGSNVTLGSNATAAFRYPHDLWVTIGGHGTINALALSTADHLAADLMGDGNTVIIGSGNANINANAGTGDYFVFNGTPGGSTVIRNLDAAASSAHLFFQHTGLTKDYVLSHATAINGGFGSHIDFGGGSSLELVATPFAKLAQVDWLFT